MLLHVVGTQCLYAPQPPYESNVELPLDDYKLKDAKGSKEKLLAHTDINTYPFNSSVLYQCQGKMKFSHSYYQKSIQATCLEGNEWKIPENWGRCTERKEIKFIYSMQ